MNGKKKEKILVIFNARAGTRTKDRFASVVFRELREHFETISIMDSKSITHGETIVRDASHLFDLVAVFGGDGTINSIARGLLEKEVTLGILPGGSGNGLARNLKIPLLWRQSLDVLKHGEDHFFDVGIINGHTFFNVSGIGLDGYISKQYNQDASVRGILPYIYYGVKGVKECPEYHVQISLDDREKIEKKIVLAAFANFKQYGGRAVIAPQAEADDGSLDLCLIEKFPFTRGVLGSTRLFTGSISRFPYYKSYTFRSLTIKSLSGPIPCTLDGEYIKDETDTYTVRVVHNKVKIRIPPPQGRKESGT